MRGAFRRKLLRTSKIAGVLLLLGFLAVTGSNVWVAHATRGRVYDSIVSVPARDVAIVPGARVFHGKPYGHLRGRLETALMLYQGGRVRKILVSGNETTESPEASVMSAWLREHGVDAADILVDNSGSRTRDTMDRAADIYDIRDAVICTQDVSASRSVYLAKEAGISAVAVGLPSRLSQSSRWMLTEVLKTSLAFFESLVQIPLFSAARWMPRSMFS